MERKTNKIRSPDDHVMSQSGHDIEIKMQNTGINPNNHMSRLGHMVQIGSGTTREVDDYHVDRRGAYTIAVNADPHKSEVAYAKEYFIQKTAKAEVMEQRLDTLEKINNRNANSIQNKKLRNALLTRDIEPNELGIVLDNGSKGFFDQSSAEFKEEKGIPKSRSLYDYLDADVLAYKTVAQVNSRREIEKQYDKEIMKLLEKLEREEM